jgi:hypothetical protein
MSQSTKPKADFSDLAEHDAVAIVMNTAVVARDSGHPITVQHARIQGQRGILIFIPGYELAEGRVQRVVEELAPAASPADAA